jgi:hypothetical protein
LAWLPGSVPISGVVAALDRRDWLIRGADGKSPRQIVIPGFGRGRFYCLKLAAAQGGGDADLRDSDFGEPGVDRDIDPATGIDSVEPARAIGSRPNTWRFIRRVGGPRYRRRRQGCRIGGSGVGGREVSSSE